MGLRIFSKGTPMKRFVLQSAIVFFMCAATPVVANAATCKLSIVIDQSGSMTTLRTDGSGQTRCYAAATGAKNAIAAYVNGNLYDIVGGQIRSTGDEYDLNCPNLSDRLASIWVFWTDSSASNPTMYNITNGFVRADDAATALVSSGLVIVKNGTTIVPKDQCQGWTPLAQTMCRSARDFSAGPPPAGEIRKGIILTDGEENWSDVEPLDTGESRCRLPGELEAPDPNSGWGARVVDEYLSRGVAATGFLFGGQILTIAAIDPAGAAAAPAATTSDQVFFQTLAQVTGGYYTYAADTIVLDPNRDTDGDGIPDYRDFCPFNLCAGNDLDNDGIPNDQDQCIFDQEDGNGAYPADGCPDSDGDSVPDDFDLCPTAYEDHLPPKPDDGCPAAKPVPAVPLPLTGLFALGLVGLALTRLRWRNGIGIV